MAFFDDARPYPVGLRLAGRKPDDPVVNADVAAIASALMAGGHSEGTPAVIVIGEVVRVAKPGELDG